MIQNIQKVLILSPHPDDGIIGAGGTIAKFIEQGKEVHYVVFSWAGQGFNREEIKNAVKSLGIKEGHLKILNYEVRNFPYCASAIRQEMVNMREQIKPDMVLAHTKFDFHQDHEVVSREAFRVFREGTLWGYVLPWNIRDIRFDVFNSLEEKHLDKKLKAMKLLNSQQWRFYYKPEKIKALAIATGLFRRKEFAESFEIMSQTL